MSDASCWGVFRELEHSPGRETDDGEILRLTGKHLEARGFPVTLKTPEEVLGTPDDRPLGVFLMCERLEILEHLRTLELRGRVRERRRGVPAGRVAAPEVQGPEAGRLRGVAGRLRGAGPARGRGSGTTDA